MAEYMNFAMKIRKFKAMAHGRIARKTRIIFAQVIEGGAVFSLAAFPGAVGFGAGATGGRGGTVVHVTNLNDSGPGSFRDAVSHTNRIIVFDVGGYINLQSAVSVNSNITILGQTAPGDGIGFMGREVSFSNKSNDIVEYVRFRQGDLDPDSGKSSLAFSNANDMIFNHVSVEFARWDNVDAVNGSTVPGNFTIQDSLLGAPIGQQFNAHTEGVLTNFTWDHDIFMDAHNRSPLAKTNTQFLNNVVYNYQAGFTTGNTSGHFADDVINNYFITGPSTTSASNAFYQVDSSQKIYGTGNMIDSNKDSKLNGSTITDYDGASMQSSVQLTSTTQIPVTSAADAYAHDLANAGDSLHRDSVDAYMINEVASLGTQGRMWSHQTSDGLSNSGYGTLNSGALPTDSDGDGIPDAWEISHGLNPYDASDSASIDPKTGYAYIEDYANSLVAVPEPAALPLLALLALPAAMRRRRRIDHLR